MANEDRTSRERLLTDGASIRSLPGVNAHVCLQVGILREGLTTLLALVRSVASVKALMRTHVGLVFESS